MVINSYAPEVALINCEMSIPNFTIRDIGWYPLLNVYITMENHHCLWVNQLSIGQCSILIWLVVSTHLKNISQLGSLFPIYRKIKNVPNHQPAMLVITRGYCQNQRKTRCLKMFFQHFGLKKTLDLDLVKPIAGWWLTYPSEEYEIQWEGLSHIWNGKMFETTNQIGRTVVS